MMIWQKIPDLEPLKHYLVGLYKNNQLPHALLFKGEDGGAALPIALGFIQYLYCEHPDNLHPCGECRPCKQTKNLFYPSFHFVLPKFSAASQRSDSPEESDIHQVFYKKFAENPFISFDDILKEVKGKNKQTLISVQDVHQIIEGVSYAAVGNQYNTVCIWNPELMMPAAANKLLKTLEEPPPQTLFILVSPKPEELLATIISRVQQIEVPRFSEKDITDYLIQQFHTEAPKAQEIAEIANGNINKAIHILTNYEEYTELLNDFRELARLSIKYDINGIENWIKKYETNGRESLKRFLEYSLEILHNALLQQYQLPSLIKTIQPEKEFISKFYLYAHDENIPALYELFNDAYHHITRNANIRILLSDLFLRCNELLKKKTSV